MYLVAYLRFFGHLFMKSVVSSAKASALESLSAYVTPVIFFVFVIFIKSTSTMSKKIYGLIISPWGTPCCKCIVSVRWPPAKILASLCVKNNLMYFMMSGPNPSVLSVEKMKA